MEIQLPKWGRALFEPDPRFFVLYGGRGGAKSETVARVNLVRGMQRPTRFLCGREFQNSIADSVHSLLKQLIDANPIFQAFYQVQETKILGRNGTEFVFYGIRRNINSIRSMHGVDVCWIEEANAVPKASWDVLLPTIRKPGSIFQIVFNPDQETDSTYQMFVANPQPDTRLLKVSWRDNPWFPEELRKIKDHAFRTDPEGAAHVWEGEFNRRSEAQVLLGKWRVEAFDVPEAPAANGWDGPYFGADWGYSQDPAAACELWIRNGSLYCRRERYRVGVELDHLPEFLMGIPRFHEHDSRGDAARPDIIAYLNRHGFPRLHSAPKWPGSIEAGVARLRAFESIVIHPDCPNAIHEAKTWRYKQNDAGDVLRELHPGNDHFWDAARYALQPLIRGGTDSRPIHAAPRRSSGRGGSWMA